MYPLPPYTLAAIVNDCLYFILLFFSIHNITIGRPNMAYLIAQVTRKLCPILLHPEPPLPKIISHLTHNGIDLKTGNPHLYSQHEDVYYDNDDDFGEAIYLIHSNSHSLARTLLLSLLLSYFLFPYSLTLSILLTLYSLLLTLFISLYSISLLLVYL